MENKIQKMTYFLRETVIKCLKWATVISMKSHSHPVGPVLTEKQAGDRRVFIKGKTAWD